MEHRSMAARLLLRLRRETNGAVVADMESRGIHYPRNYGVSQHVVRNVARGFAPDHEFAKYLWQQPVRELKLAAPVVADPNLVSREELKFWLDGVENGELAENLAAFLLSKTRLTEDVIDAYGCSGNKFERYAALLSAARGDAGLVPAEKVIVCSEAAVGEGSFFLLRAAGLLVSKACADKDPRLLEYVEKLSSESDENHRTLLNEIII